VSKLVNVEVSTSHPNLSNKIPTIDIGNPEQRKLIFENPKFWEELIKDPSKSAEVILALKDPNELIKENNKKNQAREELIVKSLPIIIPYGLAFVAIIVLVGNSLLTLNNPAATDIQQSQAQANLTNIAIGAIAFVFGKQNSQENND
jgi:hypothetical protein